MMKKLLLLAMIAFFAMPSIAQEFNLSGEIRPRYENRYGFGSLRSEGDEAGNFVSQRTRINFDFKNTKMIFKVDVQNVRVWGDVATMTTDDTGINFFQAWGEAIISEKFSMKLGRQIIAYDDERIFGGVAWAQQARSHDAFLFKIRPNENHKIDVGIAYNADMQSNLDQLYSNAAGYKTFQYGWYHGDFNKVGVSFLLLNTGIEYLENEGLPNEDTTIDYMQSIGPRVTFKSGNISADGAFYFQTGKSLDNSVSASYFGANFNYKFTDNFNATLGGEYLSGKDMDDSSTDVNSFAPLFGTNHKFNGLMDYFYVGNHANNVGLTDIYLHLGYSMNKWNFKLSPHYFAAAANIIDTNGDNLDDYLGTEIDFTVGYKLTKSIKIDAGYSQMFANDSMEAIKGGDSSLHNSWAWVMVTFKPNLFNHKFTAPEDVN